MKIIGIWLCLIGICAARKHHLEVRDDVRRYIALSSFGFFERGTLDVEITNFEVKPEDVNKTFGFTLDQTMSDAMNPFTDDHQDKCILEEPISMQKHGPIAYMTMDLRNKIVSMNCSHDWHNIHFFDNSEEMFAHVRQKRELNIGRSANANVNIKCRQITFPITRAIVNSTFYFNFTFSMYVSDQEEGLYNLYFHACPNYQRNLFPLNFDMKIVEKNFRNYLSAGEIPLPSFYFMMSLIFFLSGLFWVFLLKKSTHRVFRIHYLMAVLVFLKSFSLMFHSIHFHYIEIKGEHIEAWAILYYITHLLKGAVLFITIVLIGTGWTFIKHILADKEKKLFMIVIPLQILANVADIIIDESEEGDIERNTWNIVFFLVDLICCTTILIPVVWSIRHLQEASSTDGKAAMNLRKLQLFRQFYIMIVCYIYFTRFVVLLLRQTLPFQYVWMNELFKEAATYIFYVLTAYKFRPMPYHPYFQVDSDDDDDGEVEVITKTGLTENVTKVKNRNQQPSLSTALQTIINDEKNNVDADDEEKENLISNRESSHEYD